MTRFLSFITFGATLFSLAANCNSHEIIAPQRTIKVRVLNKYDGAPVPAANVWLETFKPGRIFQMGHFEKNISTQTDDLGEATLVTSAPDPLQVGAAACDAFLAQGMAVIPAEKAENSTVEIALALQYCR